MSSNSITNLNTIHDDIVRSILVLVPLQSRITKRLICHKWKRIIEATFLLVRSLKLFDSFHFLVDHYCPLLLTRNLQGDPDLRLSKCNSDDIVLGGGRAVPYEFEEFSYHLLAQEDLNIVPGGHFLVDLFPNVNKLIVCLYYNSSRIDFDHLVAHFAQQLTTLGYFKWNDYLLSPSQDLGWFLASMPNLRALHLNEADFGTDESLNQSILPKLETFSLGWMNDLEYKFLTLKCSSKLKHLNIDVVSAYERNLFSIIAQKNVQLANQLESLSIGLFLIEDLFPLTTLVDSICTHFGSIRKLHLNLDDVQHEDDSDPMKSLNFFITKFKKLRKLTNLSFRIESDYFNISPEELSSIPIMRNIVHLKVELLNVNTANVDQLERCLLVLFSNATRILLRTPYRENMDWQLGRDRLEQMVERNASIMRMDGTEEWEVDVAELLGRHEQRYRQDVLDEGKFGLHEMVEKEDETDEEEGDDEDEEEEEEEFDDFLGISIELLILLSDDDTVGFEPSNPFLNEDHLKKMEAFKRVLLTNVPALDFASNYVTMLTALNGVFARDVAIIAARQTAALALDCIRLIATGARPNRFPVHAQPWISILLYHFERENVIGHVVASLNDALDAIYRLTTFDSMLKQIEQPLAHQNASVRKATALFISRALSQVETERRIVNRATSDRDKAALMALSNLLWKASANPNEITAVQVALQLASIECNHLNNI